MDIEEFKYVLALARYKHFTEASYEVSLSQSSLSKHLGKIEREMGGIRLFDRATRPIKLTDAGKEFVQYAQQIVDDFESLKLSMQEYTMSSKDKLAIGSIPILSRLGLTSVIVSFQKAHPKINIEIMERQNRELLELLKRTEIDVAIVTSLHSQNSHPSITYYPLIEDEVVIVTRQNHALASQIAINLEDAANEVFFLLDSGTGMYKICMDAFRAAGFTPSQIRHTRTLETAIGLVAEGLGISLMTYRLAKSFSSEEISIIHLKKPFMRVTALAVRNQPHLPHPVKTFINYVLEWKTTNSCISSTR